MDCVRNQFIQSYFQYILHISTLQERTAFESLRVTVNDDIFVNINPFYLFSQCFFIDFPINKALIMTIYSFIHHLHCDMFRPLITVFTGQCYSSSLLYNWWPKHVVAKVIDKRIQITFLCCINREISEQTLTEMTLQVGCGRQKWRNIFDYYTTICLKAMRQNKIKYRSVHLTTLQKVQLFSYSARLTGCKHSTYCIRKPLYRLRQNKKCPQSLFPLKQSDFLSDQS